jgi:hypothetical protein
MHILYLYFAIGIGVCALDHLPLIFSKEKRQEYKEAMTELAEDVRKFEIRLGESLAAILFCVILISTVFFWPNILLDRFTERTK